MITNKELHNRNAEKEALLVRLTMYEEWRDLAIAAMWQSQARLMEFMNKYPLLDDEREAALGTLDDIARAIQSAPIKGEA